MDKRGCGAVRRCDFYEASTEYITLEMRRTITRGNLHERFRSSAAEMTLQELLRLVWPTSSEEDRKQMTNWAKLRDASLILTSSSFEGSRGDLKRIFDLLDIDGSHTLSLKELVRARILTKGESRSLLERWYTSFNEKQAESEGGKRGCRGLSFNEFCLMTQKHLHDKFAQKDGNTSWEKQWRSTWKASKATTAKVVADREGRELPPENEVSPKIGMKTVGVGVKAVHAFGFAFARNSPATAGVVMAC